MTKYPELNAMVRGTYDLQKLRIQTSLRLYANFRQKLKEPQEREAGQDPEEIQEEEADELSDEAESLIERLRASYKLLTTGIAKNRDLPAREGFVGDGLISTFSELVLVNQLFKLEEFEAKSFRQFEGLLTEIPIYTQWLSKQRGCGPAMSGIIVSLLDPHKARHISSFWKYAGVDVASDGRGRSRQQAHLVERTYKDKDGNEATRMGITYNPLLKTKLCGVLAGSFIKSNSPWRAHYDNYKHRIETDPNREKCTVAQWKKRNKAGEDLSNVWTPGRINNAAKRYLIKQFLAGLWIEWRKLEGLPVTLSYNETRRGYGHGEAA